jgi:3-methyl-2-oxobutanoate hydroxymethyltransferase
MTWRELNVANSKVTIKALQQMKDNGEKIATLTAYDATFAATMEARGVEMILVGDSLGMVLQGHDSTLPVSIDDMTYHVAAVKRGTQRAFIVADLPFMSYATYEQGLASAQKLMQAGAHMIKLEGGQQHSDLIQTLVELGTPVCGHLGLTPQSVNAMGGYKVQGKEAAAAEKLIQDAMALEVAGCQLLVLECVPTPLAQRVTSELSIPVIGIGAGNVTDGQVLVMHDMLGLNLGKPPKFVKNFMAEASDISDAFGRYVSEVKAGTFPGAAHSFH